MMKVKKLRHNEYYNLQKVFDKLYADSQKGKKFNNLMEIIASPENIRLAYRNIKNNKGSHTYGTDKCTIENNNNLLYKIGSIYKNGLGIDVDMDKAIDYFQRSAKLGNRNAKRILALEYISGEHIEQNIEKGLAMLTECADSGDSMSCYNLGRLYLFGSEEIEKNKEKAVEWLTKSADGRNTYAQNLLSNIEQFENAVLANTIFGMLINLSRCMEDDYAQKYKSVKRTVDSRLRRMISQKKQSLGIKNEPSQSHEQSY